MNEPQFEGEEMKLPGNTSTTTNTTHNPVFGLIIALLFLTLVLVLGGLLLWYRTTLTEPTMVLPTDRPTPAENNEPESTTAEARSDAATVVSTSHELDAIEADIKSTDLTSVETDLTAIDADLNTLNQVVAPETNP
jgi:hypothetical protein